MPSCSINPSQHSTVLAPKPKRIGALDDVVMEKATQPFSSTNVLWHRAVVFAALLSVFNSGILNAKDLPPLRMPTSPIEMRLTPGYSVTCTKTEEVEGEDATGPVEVSVIETRVNSRGDRNVLSLQAKFPEGFSFSAEGTIGAEGKLRDVTTHIDAEDAPDRVTAALEKFASDALLAGSSGPIVLRQGLKLPWQEILRGMMSSFVNFAPDARLETSPDATYDFAGITTIDGEDFAVFEFDGEMKLIVDRSTTWEFALRGYQLVHVASGLQFNGVSKSRVVVDNKTVEMVETNQCSLEVMEKYRRDEGRSSEEDGMRERLQSIKSLLDDGLISPEEAAALRAKVLGLQ